MAANAIAVIPTPLGQGSALVIPGSSTFERANSDYLAITPSTDGNERTFTISWWFRLTETPGVAGASGQSFFISTSTPSNSENVQIYLSDDAFIVNTRHEGGSWTSTKPARRFRDNSAWYHMVVAIDTTQSTGTDRLKIYINGELNSDWSSDGRASITQNTDLNFCSATEHCINNQGAWSNVYGQYNMSHFYLIDGQALDASNFGYTDPLTNTWRPKKFSGNYTIDSDGYGLRWSNYWGGTAGGEYNVTDGGAFTGGTSGYIQNGSAAEIHWTPASPISISSSLQVYVTQGVSGQLELNDSSVATTNNDWTEIATSGTLTKLSLLSGSGSQWVQLKAVKVDGTILTDFEGVNSCYLPLDGTGYSSFQTIGNMVQDQSGRQNNWTKNGSPTFSTDTPSGVALSIDNNAGITTTGVPTNYCTLNPLNRNSNGDATEGNLVWYRNGSWATILGTVGANTGKWYFELTHIGGTSSEVLQIGIAQEDHSLVDNNPLGGSTVNRKGIGWISSTGSINSNGGHDGFGTWVDGDTVGCAVDIDEKKIWFHKNGTWILSRGGTQPASGSIGNPALGTHPIFDPSSESSYAVGSDNGCNILPGVSSQYGKGRVNFGQTAFAYAPPKGFKPWCTANIPQTGAVRPSEYFDTVLYTGNGSTQNITGLGFQPDLLWIKNRDAAVNHWVIDAVRGKTKILNTNNTLDQGTDADAITSFNSDGFTLGDSSSGSNGSGVNYVSWIWKAGGNKNTFNIDDIGYSTAAAAGLDGGSTTPTGASVGTKQGFSIIQYTGNNSNTTISHGLKKAPKFIIQKFASNGGNWNIYHHSLGNTQRLTFTSDEEHTGYWNSTDPTASVFSIGSGINDNGVTMVAYLWHNVEGLQRFGSYTGNGAKKFVYLGFRPARVMLKRVTANSSPDSSTGYTSWTIVDTKRLSYNGKTPNHLFANLNVAEGYRGNGTATSNLGDMTVEPMSSGFYLNGPGSEVNASTGTYIYCAWAEAPFQNLYGAQSNAR